MKVKVNIREFLEDNADHNGNLQVSADIHLDDILFGMPEDEEIDIDIDELLAENRQIAHIWGIDDVKQLRPDLDDDASWAVLMSVRDDLDSDHGITWDTVKTTADELYPQSEGPWQGRIDVSVENYTREAAIEHFEQMAEHVQRDAVNSTTRAVFDPASLRLAEPGDTDGKAEAQP